MTRSQEVDWTTLRASEPFQELLAHRSRFVRAASTVLLCWFVVFLAVIGAAPDFAGTVVFAGLSVGFLLGLSQFVLAWFLTWLYLRAANTRFAPLEDQVRALTEAAATEGPEVAR
ncbi:hypothetical protein GCM10010472_44300 [Pseudonocardia halophobica]|uniref:DUF485 domain-containing protein n=1 Tax=Pseudonocardia halophobica TaxID=29401 RepID=A0A9W6NZ36_9PSEU|nr:DUF485 domain-containing protein [Pseudonocardia halophobica]GLL14428.1 hypothetical protein GCM10017577_55750 [Pseudonocardia halophobica]